MGEGSFPWEENQKDECGRQRRASRAHEEAEHLYTARPVIGLAEEDGDWKTQDRYPRQEPAGSLWSGESWRGSYVPNEAQDRQEEALLPPAPSYTPNEEPGYEDGYEPAEEPMEQEAPLGADALPQPSSWAKPAASYYGRPSGGQDTPPEVPGEVGAFAPPPKISHKVWEDLSEEAAPVPFKRHVYQPRQATWAQTGRMDPQVLQGFQYQVEAPPEKASERRRKGRGGKRVLAALCVLAVFGGVGYVGRDWIAQQIALLTGAEPVNAYQQADAGVSAISAKGYDPAPQTRLGIKAQQGIAEVSGTLEMEQVAVTADNVVARNPLGQGLYDYYLFAGSDGRLLAYFDGLSATDFIAQPNDTFYVSKTPYLLDARGKALIRPATYEQTAGRDAVLGPLENGWAVIRNDAGTKFNYINAQGKLLSTLWFCRAFPFWGEHTLAYVDTGNLAKPQERYALYVLSKDGLMELWRHAADTGEVVGTACNLTLLNTGELVRLSDLTTISMVEEVSAYLDCDAVVAKDQESGKYGLFVSGEQHYDFAYEQITPIPCEIQWVRGSNDQWVNYAVSGAPYPQPLSHYFRLTRPDGEEQIALSTRSCCPVLMK